MIQKKKKKKKNEKLIEVLLTSVVKFHWSQNYWRHDCIFLWMPSKPVHLRTVLRIRSQASRLASWSFCPTNFLKQSIRILINKFRSTVFLLENFEHLHFLKKLSRVLTKTFEWILEIFNEFSENLEEIWKIKIFGKLVKSQKMVKKIFKIWVL